MATEDQTFTLIGAGVAAFAAYKLSKYLLSKTDSQANRKRAVALLSQHTDIKGFNDLWRWLKLGNWESGVAQFDTKDKEFGLLDPFTIGDPPDGDTTINGTLKWLQQLTAAQLFYVEEKAILGQAREGSDTADDRQRAIDLLNDNSGVLGFSDLSKWLVEGNFLNPSKRMIMPQDAKTTITLGAKEPLTKLTSDIILPATSRSITNLAREVLKRQGAKTDPGLQQRQDNLNNMGTGGVTGFDAMHGYLVAAHYKDTPWVFTTDVTKWNPPGTVKPGQMITLGDEKPVDILTFMSNCRSDGGWLKKEIALIKGNFNPGKAARQAALNQLETAAQIPDQQNVDKMHGWFAQSGWVNDPNNPNLTGIPTDPIWVGVYGTFLINNPQDYIKTATAATVTGLAQTGTDKSKNYYTRYRQIQLMRKVAPSMGYNPTKQPNKDNSPAYSDLNLFCDWLIAHGYLRAEGATITDPDKAPFIPEGNAQWIFGSFWVNRNLGNGGTPGIWYTFDMTWAFATGDERPIERMFTKHWDFPPNIFTGKPGAIIPLAPGDRNTSLPGCAVLGVKYFDPVIAAIWNLA